MNRDTIKRPIINGFLSEGNNMSLLEKSILEPTFENKKKVEESFQSYYKKIREIKYISRLIHFFSKDFDKRVRKHNTRNVLVLDADVPNGYEISFKNHIIDEDATIDTPRNSSFLEKIESDELLFALGQLNEKQRMILEMKYYDELTLKQIAKIFNTSSQNISHHHRQALKKLNEILIK